MTATKRKPDYSYKQVRWILENYSALSEGKPPADGLANPDYGCRIQVSRSLKAIFERPMQLKTDIDNAIQSLKPTERAIIIAVCISGFEHHEVAYWWDKKVQDIQNIEDYSIRKIKRYLNGHRADKNKKEKKVGSK